MNTAAEKEVLAMLEKNSEKDFAVFQRKLLPNIKPELVLGIRTPVLRSISRELKGTALAEEFLKSLPHSYFEENQLHSFLLSQVKDFDRCLSLVEAFLPHIDNWATCDQTLPLCFAKHKAELLPHLFKWIDSEHEYTVRFAVGMLMRHFLDNDFAPEYMERVVCLKSPEYYVNMEIAWYMATALAKQWDAAVKVLEQNRLELWTHNKTIQKARESFRISPEHKEYLAALRR